MRMMRMAKPTGSHPGRPRAPLPSKIEGRYFVVHWLNDKLMIELEDETSHNLGSDPGAIVRQFRMWGLEKLGCDAADYAKQFRVGVQAIIKDSRLRRLDLLKENGQPPPNPPPQFNERKSYALPGLPRF